MMSGRAVYNSILSQIDKIRKILSAVSGSLKCSLVWS